MTPSVAELEKLAQKVVELESRQTAPSWQTRFLPYKFDPVGFAENILGVTLAEVQKKILKAAVSIPYMTLAQSANGIGKTKVAAILALWHFCCWNPSTTIITAPNASQIERATFKEIRRMCPPEIRHLLPPQQPKLFDNESHQIIGFTSDSTDGFQGVHEESLLIILEEVGGIGKDYIDAALGMAQGCRQYFVLGIFNPLTKDSAIYQETLTNRWTVLKISAFDHDNIINEIAGKEPLFPGGLNLSIIRNNMEGWGEYVSDFDHETSDLAYLDVFFEGRWWRPSDEGQARILGEFPAQGFRSIFSENHFRKACELEPKWGENEYPITGTDVARFGNDNTVTVVRRGNAILNIYSTCGASTAKTAQSIKNICDDLREGGVFAPVRICNRIDDCGVGGGVVDQRGNYNFVGINAAKEAYAKSKYPNKRSELLFNLAEKMNAGEVSLKRLPQSMIATLKSEALGLLYKLDDKGRRVAEKKADMVKRMGRSPDHIDALALAYYDGAAYEMPTEIKIDRTPKDITTWLAGLGGSRKPIDPDREGWNPI